MWARAVTLLLLAFLAGSLPFAFWAGRLRGIDLRARGSGNLGATNVLRTLGPAWGISTLLLDVGKGWIAVGIFPDWLGLNGVSAGSLWPLAATLAAILGHVFSPWTGFRGGKGVATSLGAFLALALGPALLSVAAFVGVVWLWRYVSVGSQVLALTFTIGSVLWGPPEPLRWYVVALGGVVSILIAWRHRANWGRVVKGTESRFQWRSSA